MKREKLKWLIPLGAWIVVLCMMIFLNTYDKDPYEATKDWLKNSKYKNEDIDELRYPSLENPEFVYIHFSKNDVWLKLTLKKISLGTGM